MTVLHLEWSSAEVSDAELTVGLSDNPPKKWREAFTKAAALLSHGSWEVSQVKRRNVRISPVRVGEEERVRQFLEGAVLEANAALVSEEELFDPAQADGEGGEEDEASADEELTARFRAFA